MDKPQNINFQKTSTSNHSTMAPDPFSRTVANCPSPIISLFHDSHVVHLTLDSGAEANCISLAEVRKFKINIELACQLASQLDSSNLKVLGEVHVNFTRSKITFKFETPTQPFSIEENFRGEFRKV